MRAISQDGTIDVPYEMVVIQKYKKAVYFLNRNLAGAEGIDIKLAEYSTEAKAIKAMEMLRTVYESRMELDGGYDSVHKCYVQPNFWVLPKVFQFPQDDEIEV
jgi:hypothetical protein